MSRLVIAAALALAAVLPAIPAQATSLTRTFVSSAGSDSNPCTITQPCATFARAYSLTTASGIIAALDPGKYGPMTITGPVTINGYGWAAITAPAGGNGITINAGPTDKITLIGLEIDGANALNTNGIVFGSGASLNVQNSVIENFSQYGILFEPNASSKISVSNTVVSDNTHGIAIGPTGSGTTNGVLDHVHTENNTGDGITIDTPTQTINVAITESVSAQNGNDGIIVTSANSNLKRTTVYVRNSTIVNNGNIGVEATNGFALLYLTRSMIVGNGFLSTSGPTGGVNTYGDNSMTFDDEPDPTIVNYR
jgi:hypothetical protein